MHSLHGLTLAVQTMLLLILWMGAVLCNREGPATRIYYKKRANGIDVSSFEVVCIGLKIRDDKIASKEIAVMRNYLADDLYAALIPPITGATTYQDGEL